MVKPGEVVWTNLSVKGDGPTPRSGHSLTGNGDGKCVLFGGCGIKKEDECAVFDETYVLTLGDMPAWERVEPRGDVPSPRWRHTATLLPDADGVLVFGGVCKGRRFNDTHVFSIGAREWAVKECAGTPPHPRSHHTANRVDVAADEAAGAPACSKVLVLGGYGGPGSSRDFYLDVHFLELGTYTWTKLESMKGPVPSPRSDHSAALADGKLYLHAGRGWSSKAEPGLCADVQVLDVAEGRWLEPDGLLPPPQPDGAGADGSDPDAPPAWPNTGETVWNHSAMAIGSVPSPYLFSFGGQTAPRRYANALHVYDTGAHRWEAPKTVTGAPPPAREDSPFAYDDATKSLVVFGGWRQKWLGDVWALNVAGICGPPYAVSAIAPHSGPYTGVAHVLISGLLFRESGRISVKFATKDGKKEMVVPGKYEGPTQISAKSPNFEKHGALEVQVSVSIDGEPFTVNECFYQFYLNTSARRCVAFGPGLAPTNEVGRLCSFVIQSKDSAGHYRASGGDPLRVQIDGPSGEAQPAATVLDSADGRYVISYHVPLAGSYAISVWLDENPGEGGAEALVQGCPFRVQFADVWRPSRAAGIAPVVKPSMEVAVLGGKLTVIPMEEDKDLRGIKGGQPAGGARVEEAAGADGEGAGEEGEGEAPKKAAEAPPPSFAWQLDLKAGSWALVEGQDAVAQLCSQVGPAHAAQLKANAAFAAAAKLPPKLAAALQQPHALCASFTTSARELAAEAAAEAAAAKAADRKSVV